MLFLLQATSSQAKVDPDVKQLLQLMGLQGSMVHMAMTGMKNSLSFNLTINAENDFKKLFEKMFASDQFTEAMSDIYLKHYTKPEISELLKFYQTPVGKKTINVMPQIFSQSSQIGQTLATKYQDEIQKIMKKHYPNGVPKNAYKK